MPSSFSVNLSMAAAAQAVVPEKNKDWLHQQQELLLQHKVSEVLDALEPQLEADLQAETPLRSAHGYMSQRQPYMDYAGAQAAVDTYKAKYDDCLKLRSEVKDAQGKIMSEVTTYFAKGVGGIKATVRTGEVSLKLSLDHHNLK
jgi:hypothetical protein